MEKRLHNRDDGLNGFDIKYVRYWNDLNTKRTSQMDAGYACAETVCLGSFLVFFSLREFQVLAKCVMCCTLFAY